MKSDKMFTSEKKLADILIKISTSFTGLGTREKTDLDKYVIRFRVLVENFSCVYLLSND